MSKPLHNAPSAFDRAWIEEARVDAAEVESACAAVAGRRPPAPGDEVAALLRAVACMDLTTLSDDDTAERVQALCERARMPLPDGLRERIAPGAQLRVAAVCVYPEFLRTALQALEGSEVPVCTVSGGFPTGAGTLEERAEAVRAAREAGAAEIDVVISCRLALEGDWALLHAELLALRRACGERCMKVILRTGELERLVTVARAGRVALLAGADFLKTSTGKERVNATLEAGWVMAREIGGYAARTGRAVGLKPAGGIATAAQALDWMALVESTLGTRWLQPDRLRFGASSLLDALLARLEALASGA